MKYRAEIDGLRAVAVIPVILFHAGFELFSGGFVGVDIFFVISGYLITTILMEDIEKQRFSIVTFYERRARRILPALFFIMLVSIPFAWAWMLPSQMKDFSLGLVAVSLFASNILFWKQSGYFAPAAEENPLLHTWSLAVEEQYYLIFPVFLFLAWRLGKDRVFWMIVVFAALSLMLSEWGWRNYAIANFFLAPARVWELFAGSIAAFVVQKHGVKSNNFLSLAGMAAIILPIFVYDETIPFPSLYALVPVSGVVLLVLYANKDTFAAKILSMKGFVWIGLISYSAYLWHQPLFAFARIRVTGEPELVLMGCLSILSLILAALSWRYIETPFRKSARFGVSRRTIFVSGLLGMLVFSSAGIVGHQKDGFNTLRYAKSDREYLDVLLEDNSKYVISRFNNLKNNEWDQNPNNKKILIIGDSFAQDLVNAIYEAGLQSDLSIKVRHISTRCGNLYIPLSGKSDLIATRDIPRCKRTDLVSDKNLTNALQNADEIWLASAWKEWQIGLLEESLQNLENQFGNKLVLFGRKDFPDFDFAGYVGMDISQRASYRKACLKKRWI